MLRPVWIEIEGLKRRGTRKGTILLLLSVSQTQGYVLLLLLLSVSQTQGYVLLLLSLSASQTQGYFLSTYQLIATFHFLDEILLYYLNQ